MRIEKISAITLEVSDMRRSVRFYHEVLGLEMLYGGEEASFSSFRTGGADSAILNLELGEAVGDWGRIIFHVSDVDEAWSYLTEKGFAPARPRDAPWGSGIFICSIRTGMSCRLPSPALRSAVAGFADV